MRKKKWLIIVVCLILIINGILLLAPKIININEIVETRLKKEVNKFLNAELLIGNINVTSKFIQFSDIKLIEKNGKFTITAKQFYIRFSFWRLIFSGLNFQKAIKNIRCFTPTIDLKLTKSENSKTFDIKYFEKQLQQFSEVSIINGSISLESNSTELKFKEKLTNISIKFNSRNDNYSLSISAQKPGVNSILNIDRNYKKEKETKTKISLKNFILTNFKISSLHLKKIIFDTDLTISSDNSNQGYFAIKNLDFSINDNKFYSDSLKLKIKENTAYFQDNSQLNWQNNYLRFSGKIDKIISESPQLKLAFNSNKIDLKQFSSKLSGFVTLSGNITNNLSDPAIKHEIISPSLTYNSLQIKDFEYDGIYNKNSLDSIRTTFNFYEKDFILTGSSYFNPNNFQESKFNLILKSIHPITFEKFNINSDQYFSSNIHGTVASPIVDFKIDNMQFTSSFFNIDNLNLEGSLKNNKFKASLFNPSRNIIVKASAQDITKGDFDINLTTNRLKLYKFFNNNFTKMHKPIMNSAIDLKYNNNQINLNGNISFPQNLNSNLTGSIILNSSYNTSDPIDTYLSLNSNDLEINSDPLALKLIILKSNETINIDTLQINENIYGSGKLLLSPNLDSLHSYQGKINIKELSFDYIKNFVEIPTQLQNSDFKLNSRLNFNSKNEKNIFAKLKIDSLYINERIKTINTVFNLGLSKQKIILDSLKISRGDYQFFEGKGTYYLDDSQKIYLSGNSKNVYITNIVENESVHGSLDYNLLFTGTIDNPRLLCNLKLSNGRLFETDFKKIEMQFFQNKQNIFIKDFNLIFKKKSSISLDGSYSYNIFKDEYYDIPDSLVLTAKGNLLSLVSDYIPLVRNCSGETELRLLINSQNEGITIKSGYMNINKGVCNIANQPEEIKSIVLNLTINDNIVDNFRANFQVGSGTLNLINKINDNDSDLVFGGVNLGTLLLKTTGKGLLIHVPNYSPEKSLVEVQLMGREDEFFTISKKDDFILLKGRIFLTNGKAIYEKKEDKKKEKPQKDDFNPFAFDVDIAFGKNVWFVTDPFYLRVDVNDFIRLKLIPELGESSVSFELHSHTGNIDIFGERFLVKEVTFTKSENDPKLLINGLFEKKTASGSIISLKLSPVSENAEGENVGGESYGDVRVSLESDDPNDATMLSMLSKLHYDKSYNELTADEKQGFDQSEIINLASDQLGKMLISPVISPIESTFRRWLGLDYFRLQTDWVENFARSSGISSTEEEYFFMDPDQSQIVRYGLLGRDVLLDNLSVDMGKYITPNWYVNYAATVQKALTLDQTVDYGLEHQITFRYDLPWHLRVIYMYRFSPLYDEYIQRISLETYLNF